MPAYSHEVQHGTIRRIYSSITHRQQVDTFRRCSHQTYSYSFFLSLQNPLHPNESLHFFRRLLESLFRVDIGNKQICTCQSLNRNNNASSSDDESPPRQQLYPHMRKVYDEDTALLEHVHIIMSTTKPQCSLQEAKEEPTVQRRRRPTRVSKQRAKVLITEYCSRKIVDNVRVPTNKRNYSSLAFSLPDRRQRIDMKDFMRFIERRNRTAAPGWSLTMNRTCYTRIIVLRTDNKYSPAPMLNIIC